MKKLSLICLLLGALTFTSQAQLSDKLVPHTGFMYEFVTYSYFNPFLPTPREINSVRSFYNFNIGAYYVLGHKNDVVSFGVDPSLNLGLNLFNTGTNVKLDYNFRIPVLFMGKLGALATPYNTQNFGFALGVGAQYTFFNRSLFESARIVNEKAGFLNPVVAADITFSSRSGPMTIRGIMSIISSERTLNRELVAGQGGINNIENTSFSNWGVGIIYGF